MGHAAHPQPSHRDTVAGFFSNWAVYQAVLQSDSMEHREIFDSVWEVLARRTGRLSMLDVGCGDATAVAPVLARLPIGRSLGVDCAVPVIDLARVTLAATEVPAQAEVADLLEFMKTTPETFDVILASFSLHHFQPVQKREFLAAARRQLNPGGELLLVDVVRVDGESRDQYVARYADVVTASWPVSAEVRARIIEHVRGNDFPEESSAQPAWAREVGFTDVTLFYAGGQQTQAGWRMRA